MCVMTVFYGNSVKKIAKMAVEYLEVGSIFVVVGQLFADGVRGLRLLMPKDEPIMCEYTWGKEKVWMYRRIAIDDD